VGPSDFRVDLSEHDASHAANSEIWSARGAQRDVQDQGRFSNIALRTRDDNLSVPVAWLACLSGAGAHWYRADHRIRALVEQSMNECKTNEY